MSITLEPGQLKRLDVPLTRKVVGAWACPVCGATFATYSEISAHLSAAHPAPGEQLGMSVRNITSTSVGLGAGATMGCYFVFWLEDGEARKVAQSGWVSAHVDFWRTVGGLTPGTEYLFAAFGVSGNKVVKSAMRFTTLGVAPAEFEYSNLSCSKYRIPEQHPRCSCVDLRCTIRNTGGVSGTRTVHLCMNAPYERHICYYKKDYFELTLAPGESYYYSSKDRGADFEMCGPDPVYVWLVDSAGGKSAECGPFSGE